MFNEFLLVAGLCGVTHILVRGRIFYSFRAWVMKHFPPDRTLIGYGVNCCQCVGFWVGLGGALAYRLAVGFDDVATTALLIFLTGGAVSLLSVLADRYIFGGA